MDFLLQLTGTINDWVWGIPTLVLLVGTGVILTLKLKGLQVSRLPLALKMIFQNEEGGKGDVTSFAALCTALAATIGTGNIVGVATAIKVGGPGALFWMLVAGFFGMATKYAEGFLAIKYRSVDENGQMAGGPMYYIEKGLGLKWLATLFAIFGMGAAVLGIGTMTQVHGIATAFEGTFGINVIVTGLVVAGLTAAVTIGGIKSIAKVASFIVPFMAIFYVGTGLVVLVMKAGEIPAAISLVLDSAFGYTSAVGGFAGAAVKLAIQKGIARGVFSNESGLGSAPIAAAAAKTNSPVRQGLISMTGTFIDTIIICTVTGLVILTTGAWTADVAGAGMTATAFESVLPGVGSYLVAIGLGFFAFTTILGWNYYGERCCVYLFGTKGIMPFRVIYVALVGIGAGLELTVVWNIADIMNGLMAIPNLIALVGLMGIVVKETNDFFAQGEHKKDVSIPS